MNNWRDQYVLNFCRDNGVTLQVDDAWKKHQRLVIMRRSNRTATRFIDYDVIPTLLVAPLLKEMLEEISLAENQEADN